VSKKINQYQEDEDIKIQIDKNQLKISFLYVLKYKKELIISLLVIMIGIISQTAPPYILKYVFDNSIPNKNYNTLFISGALLFLAVIINTIVNNFRMKHMNNIGQSIIFDIRKDLFAHLQKLPFSFFDTRPQGKILIRVTNYVNSLADMFSNGIASAIVDVFTFFVVLYFMFITSVKLSLVAICGLPILAIVIFSLKSIQRKARQAYSNKSSNLNAYLHESINGVKVSQAFVRKRKNSRIFSHLSIESFRAWIKAISLDFSIHISTVIISDMTVCITYYFAIVVFTGEDITVGVTIAMISYIGRLWDPINNLANLYNQVITNAAYLERILETLNEKVDIKDKENAYELLSVKGNVSFKNVDFRYDKNERYILKDFNLEVKAGEKIALVGHTGAGKTTIVNLLSRYYELTSGEIQIDGNDISYITLSSLRSKIGYMLQESYIFSGTIYDNIRYGRLDATNEEIVNAAKAVMADGFICEFKDGYNTYISEKGSSISQGQRQLISLARTMLQDPKILILDEATASIDTETEKEIIKGIEELTKGRTSFMVAHRLSTIVNADRILVIGDQKILEQGSHSELLELKGEYYKYYTTQTKL
jgi:ATP-binding cassette subfamily B protein